MCTEINLANNQRKRRNKTLSRFYAFSSGKLAVLQTNSDIVLTTTRSMYRPDWGS